MHTRTRSRYDTALRKSHTATEKYVYNRDCTVFDDGSVAEIQAHFKYHKFVNNNNNSSIASKQVKSGGACLSDFSLAHGFIVIFFCAIARRYHRRESDYLLTLGNYAS